ncbi:MAG TPA: hypothetical protein VL426_06160 [Candidatus Binatia bacterium]|jgi:hypothetical protein|nr:hypothetical protein [Candidatus Binatia bacterium]
MEIIHRTWWLWLIIVVAVLRFPGKTPAARGLKDALLGVSGILLIIAFLLQLFPYAR